MTVSWGRRLPRRPPDLTHAYGGFAQEAQALDKDSTPETVPTDGWKPPQGAWLTLVPKVTIIVGFLQAVLTIRDRATQAVREVCEQGQERVWHTDQAPSTGAFSQRLRRCSRNGLQPYQPNPL